MAMKLKTTTELSQENIKQSVASWATMQLGRAITPDHIHITTRQMGGDRGGMVYHDPVITINEPGA